MFRAKEKTIKLVECKTGEEVVIIDIDAGKGATINLMNLGLNIGNKVEVTRKSRLHGPMVVTHNGSEIAIGFGLAEKIMVEGH